MWETCEIIEKAFALCIMLKLYCFVISNEQMHFLSDVRISLGFPADIVNGQLSLISFKMLVVPLQFSFTLSHT